MKWLALLMLVGCGSRVDEDRQPPELPSGEQTTPAVDAIGCDDDGGPCLATGPHFWDGASELCLDGTGFGDEGALYVNARERETTSWSDTSVCLAASSPEYDAVVQVIRADGRRSNREAVVTPAFDLEFTVPEPLREGMVYTVTGDNLGTHVFPGASTGQVFHGIAQVGQQPRFIKPGHDEVLGPDVVVQPDVLWGCAAGPNQPCTIGGLGFGVSTLVTSSNSQVRVDGTLVDWAEWTANTVEFDWPSALSAGAHTVEITTMHGGTDSIEVTLLGHDVVRLTADYTEDPIIEVVPRFKRDPMVHDGRVWLDQQNGGRLAGGLPNLEAEAMVRAYDPADGAQATGVVADAGVSVVWRGEPWIVDTGRIAPFVESGASLSPDLSRMLGFTLGDPTAGFVTSAHARSDDLLVAVMETGPGRLPHIWHVSGSAGSESAVELGVPSVPLLSFGESPAAWMNDEGLYTGPCGNEEGDQAIWVTPWDDSSGLALGTPAEVWAASAGEGVLACRAQSDGFVFVVGGGSGATVYGHSEAGGLEVLATAPDTLPGLDFTLPTRGDTPVESVAVHGDGRVVLLLADRTGPSEQVTLATTSDGSTWSTTELFGHWMADLHGDTCAGAASSCETVSDEPTQCVPRSCPIEQQTLVDWDVGRPGVTASLTVQRAGMVLDGNAAWVVTEVVRGPSRPYDQSSFLPHTSHLERVELP